MVAAGGRDAPMTPEERKRDAELRRLYGITLAEYRRLLAAQDGVCAVCGRPPVTMALHVDHDHKTGVCRGLLCWNCNCHVVGRQRDPERLRAAARYLENPPAVALLGVKVKPRKKRKRPAKVTRRAA